MALTDENGGGMNTTMLVSPTGNVGGYGMPYPVYMGGQSGGSQSGNGFGDGNGWWILLLFILLAGGNGWGNNTGNGGGFGGGQPIIVNDGGNSGFAVQRGFDQAAIMNGLTGIQSGVQGLSTQLCNCCCDMQNTVNQGFFGVQNALCNGFNGVEQSANTRQMANMQTAFGLQTAMNQGFNQIGSQFADCCCENRLASADLKYTIATENCADRSALSEGVRDIITNQTAGIQRILDQLCADKIDAKNEKIADLERQLTMANLNASQIAQTAQIQRGQVAEVDALYQRLKDCPVPTMPVYGMTPIFTCPQNQYANNGCGCGCGNF
jgi:hypothetical protein